MDYTELLSGAGSCDVSDACDRLGVPAARSGAIRPVYPGCATVAGTVLTLTLAPGTGATLDELANAFQAAGAASAEVALVDLGGRTDVQCWGTLLAMTARLCGIRAAVVNGAVRDVDGLAEMLFPTYARGVHPAAMRGRLAFLGAGHEVTLGGLTVVPGWVVVADVNGVVLLAPQRAEEVLGAAAALANAERDLLARVRAAGDAAQSLKILRDRSGAGAHRPREGGA